MASTAWDFIFCQLHLKTPFTSTLDKSKLLAAVKIQSFANI